MMTHGSKPYIFQINTDNGTLFGSIYVTSASFTTLQAPIFTRYIGNFNAFIYYAHSTGYAAMSWNWATGSIVTFYLDTSGATSLSAIAGSSTYGFLYLGWTTSSIYQNIYKLFYSDTTSRADYFTGSTSYSTTTAITYASSSSLTLTSYGKPQFTNCNC